MKLKMVKKQVQVVFEDGTKLEGAFFLSPSSARHWGAESLEEVLNGDRKFLPMELGPEKVVLISKSSILRVSANEKDEGVTPRGSIEIPAQVVFRSGETIDGIVYQDLPVTHSRLSDYLNRSEAFFHIEVDSKDCFVASAFVRLITSAPGMMHDPSP